METTASVLQIGPLAMGLIGGLALFLFGMEQMTGALKTVAGDGMKSLLAKLTTNRFKAAFAGAFVTAVIQSSSVTTVLVVGFISAGLMNLSQSIGIIMGANIGTTITAQIIAFKVTYYALILVAAGFGIQFLTRQEKLRQYGAMLMGLGLIFFGMELMSDATRPLRSYLPFIHLMQGMQTPLTGILIGAIFTALVQSSSATTGVIIVLASQGFITLETGIALAFGANLGTCITAILAALGKPREAVQAAFVHVLFNVLGIVLWYAFIDYLAILVRWMSPKAPELEGIARLAAETPRQIANAHTVFNLANTFIFLWFTAPLAKLVQRLIPEPGKKEIPADQPQYLNDIMLQTPSLAFDIVRMELGRLGTSAVRMVRGVLTTIAHGTRQDLEALEAMDNDVDSLHGALITYLGRLSQGHLTRHQSEQLHDYLAAANYIENIGDLVETNLVEIGSQRLSQGVRISASTEAVFKPLHERVYWAVERSIEALVASDTALAREIMDAKDEITALADDVERHIGRRLGADEPNRLTVFRLESEAIEYLKRVYYFAKRIAKITVDVNVAHEVESLSA